jgi:hypothetical protein
MTHHMVGQVPSRNAERPTPALKSRKAKYSGQFEGSPPVRSEMLSGRSRAELVDQPRKNRDSEACPPVRVQKSSRHKRINTPSKVGQGHLREMLSDRSRAELVDQLENSGLQSHAVTRGPKSSRHKRIIGHDIGGAGATRNAE